MRSQRKGEGGGGSSKNRSFLVFKIILYSSSVENFFDYLTYC
jgi:hypothetical protein